VVENDNLSKESLPAGGYKEMSSILALLIAPSYMSPNAGKGGVAGSQSMSTAVHMKSK
jgi:hypothetical protein